MNTLEAIQCRHAVRAYTERVIEGDTLAALRAEIDACNGESGLHIQLVTGEPEAFGGFMAKYGKFSGVSNYIALIGKKGAGVSEEAGYYGERIVLKAQALGLNTCWVALTYSRRKCRCEVAAGEAFLCAISVGYGETQGVPHKSKAMESLCSVEGDMPDWFRRGMAAAMLAPTAVNQQKFRFTLVGTDGVKAEATGGFYDKVDLGIAKYHFEQGAGRECFRWL